MQDMRDKDKDYDSYNSTMLLTLTTTHNPATDLGYLLHKNPAKLHDSALAAAHGSSGRRASIRRG
jgi:hypothetical protein